MTGAPPASFERVVLPHLDAAYTLARYLVRDPADAEDAVQEALLRAVRYYDTLRNRDDARAWLLAIVRRECSTLYSAQRARRMATVPYDDAEQFELADPRDEPDVATHRSMVRARLGAAVAALPQHLREVLILREAQGCSYAEIATITESPIGTVMSRLSRARSRLAATLGDVLDVGET